MKDIRTYVSTLMEEVKVLMKHTIQVVPYPPLPMNSLLDLLVEVDSMVLYFYTIPLREMIQIQKGRVKSYSLVKKKRRERKEKRRKEKVTKQTYKRVISDRVEIQPKVDVVEEILRVMFIFLIVNTLNAPIITGAQIVVSSPTTSKVLRGKSNRGSHLRPQLIRVRWASNVSQVCHLLVYLFSIILCNGDIS